MLARLEASISLEKCPYRLIGSYLQNRRITVSYARAAYEKGITKNASKDAYTHQRRTTLMLADDLVPHPLMKIRLCVRISRIQIWYEGIVL